MIELLKNSLNFSLPEVHENAKISIDFQRTLRIPDDDSTYFLPPGLGNFPLRHVDDFALRVAPEWIKRGGVMLPMHQAEAMWILFRSSGNGGHMRYPFAIRVAAGARDG